MLPPWYLDDLENRISVIELNRAIKKIEIPLGTSQRGILSVILWNMAFNLLLKKVGKGKVKGFGFADDGSLIIQGRNLEYMTRLM